MSVRTAVAEIGGGFLSYAVGRPGARETQVARRQVHFAAKSAPQHRDFAAGKVEVI